MLAALTTIESARREGTKAPMTQIKHITCANDEDIRARGNRRYRSFIFEPHESVVVADLITNHIIILFGLFHLILDKKTHKGFWLKLEANVYFSYLRFFLRNVTISGPMSRSRGALVRVLEYLKEKVCPAFSNQTRVTSQPALRRASASS